MFKEYELSFDIYALILFLIIMIPNIIWSLFPLQNDILRIDSTTKTIDLITFISQILMITSLCFLKNKNSKKININLFILGCCTFYYLCWVAYYKNIINTIIILGLAVFPCLAFLIYAIDRKNIIAIISTLFFTLGHLIYAFINFIV